MDIRGFFGNKNGDSNSKVSTNEVLKAARSTTPQTSSVTAITENISQNSHEEQSKNLIAAPESLSETETIGGTTWKSGESIPYSALVETFDNIASVSGRLDKEDIFCKLFKAVIKTTPSDLVPIVYLSSNTLCPAYDGLELGIGDSLLVKAICEGKSQLIRFTQQRFIASLIMF